MFWDLIMATVKKTEIILPTGTGAPHSQGYNITSKCTQIPSCLLSFCGAYNNSTHTSTEQIPFFTDHGFHAPATPCSTHHLWWPCSHGLGTTCAISPKGIRNAAEKGKGSTQIICRPTLAAGAWLLGRIESVTINRISTPTDPLRNWITSTLAPSISSMKSIRSLLNCRYHQYWKSTHSSTCHCSSHTQIPHWSQTPPWPGRILHQGDPGLKMETR